MELRLTPTGRILTLDDKVRFFLQGKDGQVFEAVFTLAQLQRKYYPQWVRCRAWKQFLERVSLDWSQSKPVHPVNRGWTLC